MLTRLLDLRRLYMVNRRLKCLFGSSAINFLGLSVNRFRVDWFRRNRFCLD